MMSVESQIGIMADNIGNSANEQAMKKKIINIILNYFNEIIL